MPICLSRPGTQSGSSIEISRRDSRQAVKLFTPGAGKPGEASQQELIIEPGQGLQHYWADLWRYRERFFFLTWRNIAVRYKQTALGVAWAIICPPLTMVVFTVVFGRLASRPSEGDAPYAILIYAAMLPWQFFANALSESSNSLISNAQMITKVYFPHLAIPLTAVMLSFVDFLISFVILLALMLWYQYWPTMRLFTLPPLILLAFGAALDARLWMASLNVKYRDFRYVIPFQGVLACWTGPYRLQIRKSAKRAGETPVDILACLSFATNRERLIATTTS